MKVILTQNYLRESHYMVNFLIIPHVCGGFLKVMIPTKLNRCSFYVRRVRYQKTGFSCSHCRNYDPPIWYDTTIRLFHVHKQDGLEGDAPAER